MKRIALIYLFAICMNTVATFFAGTAYAQATAGTGAARILEVDDAKADDLASLALRGADAVSLDVTRATLQAKPEAWQGLSEWVRSGGVVFLHNDAAQLFGYRTVPARRATARVAGQLYGRARAALSFAAHPLLWGALSSTASTTKTAASPLGVRLVYYQMGDGDHLVTEHPAGVPLLRVSDLAARSGSTLFAAAIAPYGDGWAVFTPAYVEQHRADGALFVQNLMRLVASSPVAMGTRKTSSTTLTSVSADTLEAAADLFRGAGGQDADLSKLAQQFERALQPFGYGLLEANPTEIAVKPRLMLTRGEVSTAAALLRSAGADAAMRSRAASMIDLLRARLEMQRAELGKADAWLKLAEQLAPKSAESLLWRGVLQAGFAEDVTLPARDRAAWLADATTNWRAALTATPLSPVAQDPAETGEVGTSASGFISGITTRLVAAWGESAAYASNMMRMEPPLIAPLGPARGDLVLRYYDGDPTLRLAVPAGQLLARSDATLGWRAEEEEVLIFPQPAAYAAYRQSLPRAGGPALGGDYGDVAGNRILMISQLALPIILPPAAPGQPPRRLALGSAVPAVLGRLHAQILINALAQGGTPVPTWMRLGLVTLSNLSVVTELGGANVSVESLRPYAVAGALISPEQFRSGGGSMRVAGVPDAQSARLMMFFYARFGAGRVVETLQRLGAGEGVDDALEATTGLTEEKFFQAWYDAEFPAR